MTVCISRPRRRQPVPQQVAVTGNAQGPRSTRAGPVPSVPQRGMCGRPLPALAMHKPACRTNPNRSSGTARSRAAWGQRIQIWGSRQPSRPLCNRLKHTALALPARSWPDRQRCGELLIIMRCRSGGCAGADYRHLVVRRGRGTRDLSAGPKCPPVALQCVRFGARRGHGSRRGRARRG